MYKMKPILVVFLMVAGMTLTGCGPSRGPGERGSQRQNGEYSPLAGDPWSEVLEKGYGTLYALNDIASQHAGVPDTPGLGARVGEDYLRELKRIKVE
jgi:hypothetical protein